MKIIMIEMGCAECGVTPLGIAKFFDSVEDAKAIYPNARWRDHPQGGIWHQTGSGGAWILPEEIQTLPEDYHLEMGGW